MDKWTEYCKLDDAAKKAFFDVGSSNGSQATMHAFSVPHSQPLHVLTDQDNVDVIIGDMMFHSEDMDGVSRTRLLTSFVSTLDSSEKADAKEVSK